MDVDAAKHTQVLLKDLTPLPHLDGAAMQDLSIRLVTAMRRGLAEGVFDGVEQLRGFWCVVSDSKGDLDAD